MTPQNRSTSYALVLIATAASLVSCAPAAPPSISREATPMTEHLTARVEVVYRSYLDALALIDLTDPSEFERVEEFTAPGVYSSLRDALDRLRGYGYTARGGPEVVEFFAKQVEGPRAIKAVACTDDSGYEISDKDGRVVIPSATTSRYDQVSLEFDVYENRLVIGSSFAMSVDECKPVVDIDVYEG